MSDYTKFTRIEGGRALVTRNGVYQHRTIFVLTDAHGDRLYARLPSGFIALKVEKRTSAPGVFYSQLQLPPGVRYILGDLGYLVLDPR